MKNLFKECKNWFLAKEYNNGLGLDIWVTLFRAVIVILLLVWAVCVVIFKIL